MIYYNHTTEKSCTHSPSHSSMRNYLSCSFWSPYRASPFLMDQYTNDSWVGSLLTFFTVLSYVCPVSMKLHANWKTPSATSPTSCPSLPCKPFTTRPCSLCTRDTIQITLLERKTYHRGTTAKAASRNGRCPATTTTATGTNVKDSFGT